MGGVESETVSLNLAERLVGHSDLRIANLIRLFEHPAMNLSIISARWDTFWIIVRAAATHAKITDNPDLLKRLDDGAESSLVGVCNWLYCSRSETEFGDGLRANAGGPLLVAIASKIQRDPDGLRFHALSRVVDLLNRQTPTIPWNPTCGLAQDGAPFEQILFAVWYGFQVLRSGRVS